MNKELLLTPGPSQVPPEVLMRLAEPVFHHRTPRFKRIYKKVLERLQRVFLTSNETAVFTSSGTGAMEAAVVNVIPPGKKVLTIEGGKFGERWGEICDAFGIEHKSIPLEWGKAVDPHDVAAALEEDKDIVAVCATLCETSTGVEHPIEALGKAVAKTDAILMVDGISGAGACELRVDAWHVDILVVGSQKALMLPPGLAVITVSEKTKKLMVQVEKPPTYYFKLKAALKKAADADTPYTPALTLIYALETSLKMIEDEGIENVFERHKRLAKACREGVKAMGLEIFPERPSAALTCVLMPEGVDGDAVRKVMEKEYGIMVAGGQEQMKGRIIRIAHMGYVGEGDVMLALLALELALKKKGVDTPAGAGVKAAQEVFAADA